MGVHATVTDNPAENRFDVTVDGEHAGAAFYRERDGRISFTHTEVEDEFEGQGVGSELAAGALDAARDRGLAVLPFCPFIRSYIERHDEYLDLVPEGERPRFGL